MNGDEFKGRGGGGGKWSEKRRNDWKRWNWQGRDVKCFLGLWEKKFAFPFVAYRLHFKPSSTQGSA